MRQQSTSHAISVATIGSALSSSPSQDEDSMTYRTLHLVSILHRLGAPTVSPGAMSSGRVGDTQRLANGVLVSCRLITS